MVDDTEKVCNKSVDDITVLTLSRFALESGGNFFVLPIDNYIQVFFSKFRVVKAADLLLMCEDCFV